MGVRRERPAVERSGDSILVRLPDGTTKAMPVDELRGPVTADLCCFCGQSIQAPEQRIRLSVTWIHAGRERTQSWGAHHRCLAERMHDSLTDSGDFFGD
jgi:hypothetical protein